MWETKKNIVGPCQKKDVVGAEIDLLNVLNIILGPEVVVWRTLPNNIVISSRSK